MRDKELIQLIDDAILNFKGQSNDVEGAIGALLLGRHLGWKPLFLMHDKKKIRKYEEILGSSFDKLLPEVGPKADKSLAWHAFQKFNNFWKAVSGNIPGVRSNELRG